VARARRSHRQDLQWDPVEVVGRRRRGQVHDEVDSGRQRAGPLQRPADVVLHQREALVAEEAGDVVGPSRAQVVDSDDVVAARHESFTYVAPDEAGAAGHHDASHQARPTPR
jgi:hypothetical protein